MATVTTLNTPPKSCAGNSKGKISSLSCRGDRKGRPLPFQFPYLRLAPSFLYRSIPSPSMGEGQGEGASIPFLET
jgi:hypothetical protein